MEKEGLVFKSTGSWYTVLNEQGDFVDCRLKGKIRLKGIKSTNPVAVGDVVYYEDTNHSIIRIKDRKNYLIRRSNNLSKYSHIIAANIDVAMLIVSFKNPRTSLGFIDRFLLTCEAYGVDVLLVMNKCDQLTDEELDVAAQMLAIYDEIGYQSLMISALEQNHWPELLQLLQGKTTLLSGHSGVGKSTIINKLIPGLELKTGDISEVNYKGKHTTTFAEMFRLNSESFIIDTPGIKDFGLVNMDKHEVSHYFREMAPLLQDCKFSNCLHENEPGCAIRAAVEQGEIDGNRYHNYLNIISGDEEVNNPDYLWRKTL
ncbi:ribosome small subunit-dependent GTPase A [bacterium]|nr:ribosome small subunit-dependent GTPase A [bacterium]